MSILLIFCLLISLCKASTYITSVGDVIGNSSALIKASINITVIDSANITAVVYESCVLPNITNHILPLHQLKVSYNSSSSNSSGPVQFDYNYLGNNQPLYLLPGSTLTYQHRYNITSTSTNCSAHLNLIHSTGTVSSSIISSVCIPSNQTDNLQILNVTTTGLYYVVIEIDSGVNITITSDVSVLQKYYDVSRLKSPNECNQTLNFHDPSCIIKMCYCNTTESYLIVNPTGNVLISFEINNTACTSEEQSLHFSVVPSPIITVVPTTGGIDDAINPSLVVIVILCMFTVIITCVMVIITINVVGLYICNKGKHRYHDQTISSSRSGMELSVKPSQCDSNGKVNINKLKSNLACLYMYIAIY